jgi:hypothetical protein
MHHIYLHIVKETIELWFSEDYNDVTAYPWSLYAQLDQIDIEYCSIQILHGCEEPPHSLKEKSKWKGM